MKKLLLSLPLALLAGFAVMSSGAASTREVQQLQSAEALVSIASTSTPAPSELMCGRCGDGACVASCGENSVSCPKDCGVSSQY